MHPVIRFIALILFSVIIFTGSISILISGFSLIIGLYVITSSNYLHDATRLLGRMRWFFVSIIIVYFWFTPGEALFDMPYDWMPTQAGVILGLSHVVALITIILAVNLFLKTTAKKDLMSAIIWLTTPLSLFGDFHQRFAVRMTLTLDAVANVQALCENLRKNQAVTKNPMIYISSMVTAAYQQVLKKAEEAPCDSIEIPAPTAPPLHQWIYLPCIGILFLCVSYY